MKTMLLLAHPAAVNAAETIPAHRWDVSWLPNVDLYSWMVTNEPPPECLSVWLSLVDSDAPARPDKPVMFLPRVVADGRSAQFMIHR